MSLIGHAALLLDERRQDQTVNELWTRTRSLNEDVGFSHFVDALTILHALGTVELRYGILRWSE
ncbi:hypothetical protein BI330_06695 [Mycobacterium sp. CBMA 623]|nr:hypothetical protein [Mycobacteroides sp. CBMA 326]